MSLNHFGAFCFKVLIDGKIRLRWEIGLKCDNLKAGNLHSGREECFSKFPAIFKTWISKISAISKYKNLQIPF